MSTPDGLREAVLAELGACPFKENVNDGSMCLCGLPAVNHDTYAEQIVLGDHPAVAALLAEHPDTPAEDCAATCAGAEFLPGVWADHLHKCRDERGHDYGDHRCACGAAWGVDPAEVDAGDVGEGLSEAERESLRTSGSWPNVGRDIFAAVEHVVADRERKAAERALREAADRVEDLWCGPSESRSERALVAWLRAEADVRGASA